MVPHFGVGLSSDIVPHQSLRPMLVNAAVWERNSARPPLVADLMVKVQSAKEHAEGILRLNRADWVLELGRFSGILIRSIFRIPNEPYSKESGAAAGSSAFKRIMERSMDRLRAILVSSACRPVSLSDGIYFCETGTLRRSSDHIAVSSRRWMARSQTPGRRNNGRCFDCIRCLFSLGSFGCIYAPA
jgi:hypothetical protein